MDGYNVRTLTQTGQQDALARNLETFKIDVFFVSETRKHTPASVITLHSSDATILFRLFHRVSRDLSSSVWDQASTGIALRMPSKCALFDWISINIRLYAVRLEDSVGVSNTRLKRRVVFSPYLRMHPINAAPLGSDTGSLFSKDCVVFGGDFNFKLVYLAERQRHIGGRFSLPADSTDNVGNLSHVCFDHWLFLANGEFRQKKRHRLTWNTTSFSQHWSQIDYTAIGYR